MVVGEHKTLPGDDLGGTPATELHDGILDAGMVDAIDFLGGELEPHFLHVALVEALQMHQEPHAFIGKYTELYRGEE